MSTYAIADAINNLADNLKYAIGARNQIEKEKLAFEKEKFELNKAHKEEKLKSENYYHNWIIEVTKSDYIDEKGNEYCVVHQHCCKCGMIDVRMQQLKT